MLYHHVVSHDQATPPQVRLLLPDGERVELEQLIGKLAAAGGGGGARPTPAGADTDTISRDYMNDAKVRDPAHVTIT